MIQSQTVSRLPVISLVKISTIVCTVARILGVSFAGQTVVLITKYPASILHSMTSPQFFADVTGDLGHEDATVPGTAVVVVVVVVANDVRTVSEGISSLSFLM